MGYSDKDLMVATQIAYYDVSPKDVKTGYSIEYVIKNDKENGTGTYQSVVDSMNEAAEKHGKDSLQYKRYSETLKMYDSIADGKGEYAKYGEWKVVSVKDDNDKSGFYGCVIETDKDNAIVSYRGSESTDSYQKQKDWGEADFGLLNSTSTDQQAVGREYLNEIMKKTEYKNYTGTGHSLGDNLITDAYLYSSEDIRNRMTVYGFDGPNYSEEYVNALEKYYEVRGWDLEEATGKITHYQWSLVGAIFAGNLPGINFRTVKTTDDVYGNLGFTALTQKHAVVNLEFDKEGNLIEGKMDPLSKFVAVLTNGIDAGTHTDILPNIIVALYAANEKEKKELAVMVFSCIFDIGISETIIGVLGIIICFSIIGLVDIVYENVISKVLEKLKDAANTAVDKLVSDIQELVKKALEFINTAKDVISKVLNYVKDAISKFKEWLYKNSAGYKAASANPYIEINTTTMRSYAAQLSSLSNRAKRLDSRMNSLYWQLGIEWDSIANLGKLLKAEAVLDYAYRLDKCVNYLNQTASDFDDAEKDLLGVC